mmetsp:Transcript_36356/g.96663  ORF Transcript_36356/g.96663 Transcript_36356/m.96663 type:complete len:240 (-) Transcript_36356:397-1116(-)
MMYCACQARGNDLRSLLDISKPDVVGADTTVVHHKWQPMDSQTQSSSKMSVVAREGCRKANLEDLYVLRAENHVRQSTSVRTYDKARTSEECSCPLGTQSTIERFKNERWRRILGDLLQLPTKICTARDGTSHARFSRDEDKRPCTSLASVSEQSWDESLAHSCHHRPRCGTMPSFFTDASWSSVVGINKRFRSQPCIRKALYEVPMKNPLAVQKRASHHLDSCCDEAPPLLFPRIHWC